MAIRYAVATGNWSDVATWDGGASIPASGDYVYANSYTVTLDVDVNIGSGTLSTEICPTTSAGGGRFTFATNRIIVGNIKAGTTHCVQSTAATNTLSTIAVIGNVDGNSSTACGIYQTISSGKNNLVEITGNITKYAVIFVRQSSLSRVYFNQIGNADTSGGYCLITNYTSLSITVVEISLDGIITGNGYEFADPAASQNAGFGSLGTYNLTGQFIAQTALPVIRCVNIIGSGIVVNFGGRNALDVSTSIQFTYTSYTVQNADGNDVILYPSTTLENPPAESDVRAGVVYGIGDAYEGTLNVGATPAEFVAALVESDLGVRLSHCSTVEITGEQIASYDV